MKTPVTSHYTFGDSDLAAQRLGLLAAAFEPSSEEFIAASAPGSPGMVLDLGAGIGFTTDLLARVIRAPKTIGYERSAHYLKLARQRFPELEFKAVDILETPYPDTEVDLIYARFILTHVHSPHSAIELACRHLRPGGFLLLEETSDLTSPIPCLTTYYRSVAELQAHHGQETYIGTKLREIAEAIPGTRVKAVRRPIAMPAKTMARMHAMNISTWKKDPFMRANKGAEFLDQLEHDLWDVVEHHGDLPDGICEMSQVVIEKAE